MNPGSYPLQLYRGDSYRWKFTLFQDVNQQTPADLTGVTVTSQIRDKPGGSFICAIQCTVILPNEIDGFLAASDCATLPASAAWDLQLVYPTGDVATVLAGPVNITPDVTTLVGSPTPPPLRAPRSKVMA